MIFCQSCSRIPSRLMAYADCVADDKTKTGRQLGETGETVRRNIRWIRDIRGLSGAELSHELSVWERQIPVLGIQRIEAGTRRVDVDDLVAIAAVLGVSPATLLMPLRADGPTLDNDRAVSSPGTEIQRGDVVETSAWRQPVRASWLWNWLTAAGPLVRGTMSSFVQCALPVWERERIEAEMRTALASRPIGGLEGDVPDVIKQMLDGPDGDD